MNTDPQTHITNHLLTNKSLPVSSSWLSQLLSTQRVSNTPISVLTQTAISRVLASNLTVSISTTDSNSSTSQLPHHLLPVDISDPTVRERRIPGPVPVQVLHVEDIGTSSWSQIEGIESKERGEETRGREIIRTVTRDEGGDASLANGSHSSASTNAAGNVTSGEERGSSNSKSSGPHKLIIQDARGTEVEAFELKPMEEIGIGKISIGLKLILNNATVSRGMLLLEPASVRILGGKIEQLDRQWKEGRKERLLTKIADTSS